MRHSVSLIGQRQGVDEMGVQGVVEEKDLEAAVNVAGVEGVHRVTAILY